MTDRRYIVGSATCKLPVQLIQPILESISIHKALIVCACITAETRHLREIVGTGTGA
jgi:hypothetical protein